MSNGLTLPFNEDFKSDTGTAFAITVHPSSLDKGGDAVYGECNGAGSGVAGVSANGSAVSGSCGTGPGPGVSGNCGLLVSKPSVVGAGVAGAGADYGVWGGCTRNTGGYGVWGSSDVGVGVYGASASNDAIQGRSQSSQHAAVSGVNSGGGFGVWAQGHVAGSFAAASNPKNDGNALQVVDTNNEDALLSTSGAAGHAAVAAHNNGGGAGVWAQGHVAGYFEAASNPKNDGNALQVVDTNNEDALVSTSFSAGHAAVSAWNKGGGSAFWGASDKPSGTGIYARGAKQAALFDGAVQVNGKITLGGGGDVVFADCAEEFDVSAAAISEPGTVMVITDDEQLEPSRLTYDKRAAGVVSGAGNLRPGIVLGAAKPQGKAPESSRGRVSVALMGKVNCKVDASRAPIEVGDMLTTSPTVGHAMKACDPARAFGAVIGKALRPLATGTGLIPILIALQ